MIFVERIFRRVGRYIVINLLVRIRMMKEEEESEEIEEGQGEGGFI